MRENGIGEFALVRQQSSYFVVQMPIMKYYRTGGDKYEKHSYLLPGKHGQSGA